MTTKSKKYSPEFREVGWKKWTPIRLSTWLKEVFYGTQTETTGMGLLMDLWIAELAERTIDLGMISCI